MVKKTVFDQMMSDERVITAKRLIREALADYSSTLSLSPADETLKPGYDALLKTFGEQRGGALWYPYLGSGMGNGALVEMADGSVKYDFISGIGVHWGHSLPNLVEAGVNAALQDIVMQGNLQQNVISAEVTALFLEASGMDRCFLTSSGVMAAENALKIAFHKRHPAKRILAFERSFAGRTLAMAQVTDKPGFREGLPATLVVDYVPFFDERDPEGSTKRAAAVLRSHLRRYPGEYAAMVFELIQGEGGFNAGTRAFFTELMTILRNEKVLVFVDEVQTFGRTDALFAFKYYGLEDFTDIVTVGKLTQVCATMYRAELQPKGGLLSQTFTASTSAMEAAKVILTELLHGGYRGENGRINRIHRYFTGKLAALSEAYPEYIRGPFGIGCMIAFTPYDGSREKAEAFVKRLFENGVVSFLAGSDPARVRFLVPIGAVTEEDIDAVVRIVEATLNTAG